MSNKIAEGAYAAQSVSQTFSGLKQWFTLGNYFRLLSTVNPVDLVLKFRGQKIAEVNQVEAGFFLELEPDEFFDEVNITTGGSEAVTWLAALGKAGYDRLFASVTISSVSINAGSTLGSSTVTVDATAVALVALNTARGALVIENQGPSVVYIGAAGVTTSNGIGLAPGEKFTSPSPRAALYAISAVAGNTVRVLETT